MALISGDGVMFLLRWIHFLSGITWIGLLYYFNFVQIPFVGETQPAERGALVSKLVQRALWWFRWGAMFTFLSGWIYVAWKIFIATNAGFTGTGGLFTSTWGLWITTG